MAHELFEGASGDHDRWQSRSSPISSSPRAVDLAAMIDREDRHDICSLIDLVDDPVVTAVRAVLPLELEPELMTNSSRIFGEVAVRELHHGRRHLLGHTGQVAQGAG